MSRANDNILWNLFNPNLLKPESIFTFFIEQILIQSKTRQEKIIALEELEKISWHIPFLFGKLYTFNPSINFCLYLP